MFIYSAFSVAAESTPAEVGALRCVDAVHTVNRTVGDQCHASVKERFAVAWRWLGAVPGPSGNRFDTFGGHQQRVLLRGGTVLFEKRLTYDIALPRTIFAFVRSGFEEAVATIGPALSARLCGIGIAAPFEIWKWDVSDPATQSDFLSWKDISFQAEMARFTDLPVFMVNDATSACWAEHVYGRGREFRNYAYFFVSTFIGGGIVLNQSVFEGPHGNAAAFGPLRIRDHNGQPRQLLDVASVHVLAQMLADAGHDPRALWHQPQDWRAFAALVDPWIDQTAHALADAIPSVCSVIDFEAIVIDGYLPVAVRTKLTRAIRDYLPQQDNRGLITPRIEEGQVGSEAHAIGAACVPIFAQYFLGARSGGAE